MTREKAIDKMEFCKLAYQRMIDENSQEGVFVGKGFEGKWKADTPLYKVYEDMRDACDMSIKALEQEPCENAISRQATIEAFQMFRGYEANRTNAEWVDRIETVVEKLPPVNPQEPKYCDRNICVSNEYNGIGCDECEVTKSQKPKTGHWIPVSERLPEEAFGCLVTIFDTDLKTQDEFENILPYFVGYDGETWNNADGEPIPFEVVAWMPLPEPYKVESEDI